MEMETEFYVLAHWKDNTVNLIGLQARTESRSRDCVTWQEDGNFDAKYHVCRYDATRRDFVCIDTLVPYTPEQGPFTVEAFQTFMTELHRKAINSK